ncbi:hypothetical protein CEXT_294961 [Caerostris extrusa]|uniref:Uncharacterized protein n=1 Tax=Caerostris extrusa TaxID=172846 RepID=A0AAV4RR05_CAEEX|nr:hypothetical protein CEXT_294961 [Caerostris extrusa]
MYRRSYFEVGAKIHLAYLAIKRRIPEDDLATLSEKWISPVYFCNRADTFVAMHPFDAAARNRMLKIPSGWFAVLVLVLCTLLSYDRADFLQE